MAHPNPSSNRLRAAREACGMRSCKALVEHLDAKGYSYGKLSKIESGEDELAPQDAAYIAERLGLPRSFFTADLNRLGDVAAGEAAAAQPVTLPAVERPARTARTRGRAAGVPSDPVLPPDPLAASDEAPRRERAAHRPASTDAGSRSDRDESRSGRKRA